MYRIYTDKNEDFSCDISVKNASLKNSIARLIVESDSGTTLAFSGKINGDKCIIPIRRLKGILDENDKGKMHLEIIVEDTYFKPWQSDFIVDEHTSVKVNVNEECQSFSKPSVKIKPPLNEKMTGEEEIYVSLYQLLEIFKKFGITRKNISQRENDFIGIIKEYFKMSPGTQKTRIIILENLKYFM